MKSFPGILSLILILAVSGGAAELAAQAPGPVATGAEWTDGAVQLLSSPVISALLIMFGLAGLMYAIKTGHLGMFAAIGLGSIALFFSVQYAANLAEGFEVMMFVVGIALILAEVFLIPGFGVVGILGAVMLVASLFLALVGDFSLLSYSTITVPLYTLAASFVGVILSMALMIRYLPTSSSFTRFVLNDQATPMSSLLPPSFAELSGATGEAVTTLRPAGVALLRGERHDVITDGGFIAAGESVRVVRVEGRKIIVQRNGAAAGEATGESSRGGSIV
jgi:membrane-bound serine protease (ClpP class)